jgi:hypothetical protein
MTGLTKDLYAYVSLTFIGHNDKDEWVHEVLFEEKRLAQDITETMSIEQWSLATLANHTDLVKAYLAGQIEKGSKTLMGDLETHKNLLRVAAWPALL